MCLIAESAPNGSIRGAFADYFSHFCKVVATLVMSMGLAMWAFMPLSKACMASSWNTLAVRATMGMFLA